MFISKVKGISWLDLYLCQDVNEAVRLFVLKITSILDQMAPIRRIQLRSNFAPWISPEVKAIMRKRDYLQQRASNTKKDSDTREYKMLRNHVNKRLKNEKKNWQKAKLQTCSNDPGLLWKNVTSLGSNKLRYSLNHDYNVF